MKQENNKKLLSEDLLAVIDDVKLMRANNVGLLMEYWIQSDCFSETGYDCAVCLGGAWLVAQVVRTTGLFPSLHNETRMGLINEMFHPNRHSPVDTFLSLLNTVRNRNWSDLEEKAAELFYDTSNWPYAEFSRCRSMVPMCPTEEKLINHITIVSNILKKAGL